MIDLEEKFNKLDIQTLDYSEEFKKFKIQKAKLLNVDRMLLYFYNNRELIRDHIKIERDTIDFLLKKRGFIKRFWNNFYETFNLSDSYGHNFLHFGIKETREYNGSKRYVSKRYVSKIEIQYYDKVIFVYDYKNEEILNINFDEFEEWGNLLLEVYYTIQKELDSKYLKQKALIDQLSFNNGAY